MGIFDNSYEKLPGLLKGKILHADNRKFTILRAEGYAKSENDRGGYKPIVTMQPGEVYCPSVQGHIMTLIACRHGHDLGGCVLLREVLSATGGIFDKAAKVSAAIGVKAAKTTGIIIERLDGDLEFQIKVDTGVGLKATEVKPSAPKTIKRGLQKNVIARLMPRITEAWLEKGKGQTIQEFVEKLVTNCANEDELLKALKAL